MTFVCYGASAVAVIGALMAITRRNAMHALIYLVLMLLALGLIFLALGAPFAAVLQVIVYAGAIMVLFVFVIMMLNLGPPVEMQERRWLGAQVWAAPAALTAALLALTVYALVTLRGVGPPAAMVPPKAVGIALYRDYLLAVELASLVLVAGLVAAFHLAPPTRQTAAVEQAEAGTPEDVTHA